MKIKIVGLYGINNCDAYYRKIGNGFHFVKDRKLASELNSEEANKIMQHTTRYLKQFNAEGLMVIE